MDTGALMSYAALVGMGLGMSVVAYLIGRSHGRQIEQIRLEEMLTRKELELKQKAAVITQRVRSQMQVYENMGDEAFVTEINKELAALRKEVRP